jgi:hypothetical protein
MHAFSESLAQSSVHKVCTQFILVESTRIFQSASVLEMSASLKLKFKFKKEMSMSSLLGVLTV